MSAASATDLPPEARTQISCLIRRLARSGAPRRSDREDLQQELSLQVHAAERHFDPSRGTRSTFYARVVRSKLAGLVRHEHCAKHDRSREAKDIDTAAIPAPGTDTDVRMDISSALRDLPLPCRRVAELLMDGCGKAEVARRMELSRAQVRGACAVIATHLRDLGLSMEAELAQSASSQRRSA